MTTPEARNPRPPLSTIDRAILVAHALVAGVLGAIAFFSVDDPDWATLQRVVILMLVGAWGAGIVVTGIIAAHVRSRWARTGILLVGPLAGIVLLIAWASSG